MAISLIAAFPVHAKSDRLCPSQFQEEVKKIVQSPKLKPSRVGVFVQTNESIPRTLADLDSDRYFLPASNIKLFTTAIALKLLGADFRFTTRLISKSLPNNKGELESGLWLMGAGDPSFKSATDLKSLVTQLKKQGVKQIKGGLWATSTRKGTEIAGSWEWSDLQEDYAAIPSPFTIDGNVLEWKLRPSSIGQPAIFEWSNPKFARSWKVDNQTVTAASNNQVAKSSVNELTVNRPYPKQLLFVGGQIAVDAPPESGLVTVPDPEANFLNVLQEELIAQGIKVDKFSPEEKPDQKEAFLDLAKEFNSYKYLATVESLPLSELIGTTNRESQNLYAELILRAVGDRYPEADSDDSFDAGIEKISKYLQSVITPSSGSQVLLADGSGLSRQNLSTPRAIVEILRSTASDRNFRNSLAIAGVNGTLTSRFKNTLAEGKIHAKTGTLTGTTALSGYVKPTDYSEVIFSIMINNSDLSNKELQQYVDEIALLIPQVTASACP
ncbi:D-alanyl-D-alanine carboxypeptidase/D-alanyl-D-alanine-endopeptidase [Pseudanabaena biceps]|nr:D-alanyl-D-alanine carboxypeptidase/D-alanyl-D-alanine-endopeptidase [Pseudanabaena biceps]